MSIARTKTNFTAADRDGFALLLVLVVLIILSTAIYAISERIATYTHRQQYIIDYQKARYACDSGMKYALETVKTMPIKVTERKDESELYDFSDLFHLDKDEYEDLKWQIAELKTAEQEEKKNDREEKDKAEKAKKDEDSSAKDSKPEEEYPMLAAMQGMLAAFGAGDETEEYFDPNTIKIPGPYGPEWPNVVEPIEVEIGESTVTITVEDENAKMPITWAMTRDPKLLRQTQDGLMNFCEWMQMSQEDVELLQEQIDEVSKQKKFVLNPRPITTTTTSRRPTAPTKKPTASTRGRTTTPRRMTTSPRTTKKTRSQLAHRTDFARLIHGSIIDLEKLSRPLPNTGSRIENPLKYLGLWGSEKVNINTAPRHVLEAAFAFGGDYLEIAEEIVQRRRKQPFKSVKEFQDEYWRYSDSIEKVAPYLSTQSTFFTIKITSTSGKAKASAIAAISKNGNSVQKIVMISDF